MLKFLSRSNRNLGTCHSEIQRLINEVAKHFDIIVLEGFRSQERQNRLFTKGNTEVKFPNSKHNQNPSLAIDIASYDKNVKGKVDWNDRDRFHLLGGFVMATAIQMGIKIRWGGDWDCDTQTKDNGFDDLVHFELIL